MSAQAIVGQLALPACLPVVIILLMLGMARLEAHLLEPGDRPASPRDPAPTPVDADDRTEPVRALVPGPGELGELDEQRV